MVTDGNWHWTNDHKVMKHVKNIDLDYPSANEEWNDLWATSTSHPTNHVISSLILHGKSAI